MNSNTFNVENFVYKLFDIKRLHEESNLKMPKDLMVSYKTFDELQKAMMYHREFIYKSPVMPSQSYLVETLENNQTISFESYTFKSIAGEFNFIPTRGIPDGHIAVLYSF